MRNPMPIVEDIINGDDFDHDAHVAIWIAKTQHLLLNFLGWIFFKVGF